MSDALAQGERVELRGFGSFSVKDYGGYRGNPKTGATPKLSLGQWRLSQLEARTSADCKNSKLELNLQAAQHALALAHKALHAQV
jgi:hypothetical protein